MAAETLPWNEVTLAIIIGVLAAIVYCLRVLVLMERRVARIEIHIENLASRVLGEELKIEKQEKAIQQELEDSAKARSTKKASTKKKTAKKKTTKKK